MPLSTEEMVEKLYEDMYTGRGKENPPVVTRLDRIEQWSDTMHKIISGLSVLMLGTLLTVIGEIIAKHW